jgi:two-component system phosphate regulon sensor histidine kinase PhoR
MKSHSFFTTLFLGNIVLVGIILGFGFWKITSDMNHYASELSLHYQQNFLTLVKNGLENSWNNSDKLIKHYCNNYSKIQELRLTIIAPNGIVLGDSEFPTEKMTPHNTISHPEIINALKGYQTTSIRLSKTKQIKYRYIAEPVYHNNKIVAIARVALPAENLKTEQQNIFNNLLTGFILMLFAAIIISIFLSWSWYKPLQIINNATKYINKGNYEPIPQVATSRELIQLVNTINQMQKNTTQQLNTISKQQKQLQIILQNLPNAVIAINSNDQAIYCNKTATQMFKLNELNKPIPIQSLLRFPNILNAYYQNNINTKSESINIKINEYKYSLEIKKIKIPLEQNNNDIATLLLFNDITKITEINQMKIDFVANTSHELRTPLATIRATLDNITDGIYNNTPELHNLIKILNRHVKRLESLTDDLLVLHNIERNITTEQINKITIKKQKKQLISLFNTKITEKKIKLLIKSNNINKPFLINKKLLNLILQNLLDNAIKFTQIGGRVQLSFTFENDNSIIITCTDNGCGIPKDEQIRIFERFYRSKKRNNNHTKGTGLGLAIVKHATEQLNGTISLKSSQNKGSTFKIKIPIKQNIINT